MNEPVSIQLIAAREESQAVEVLRLHAAGVKRLVHFELSAGSPSEAAVEGEWTQARMAVLIAPRWDWQLLYLSIRLRLRGVRLYCLHVAKRRPPRLYGQLLPRDGQALYTGADFRDRAEEETRWAALIGTLCALALKAPRRPEPSQDSAWLFLRGAFALCVLSLLIITSQVWLLRQGSAPGKSGGWKPSTEEPQQFLYPSPYRELEPRCQCRCECAEPPAPARPPQEPRSYKPWDPRGLSIPTKTLRY